MDKKTIRDIEVRGKRVLVRVDFNVPLAMGKGTSAITDDSRIRAAVPTINYLLDNEARVILCSHLGRPEGKAVEELRLAPVGKRLSEILRSPVTCAPDCIGAEVEALVARMTPRQVLLLENLRFHPEEEKNAPAFAQALARLADIYVNDAFGTAHRAHASTAGVAKYLPAVAGLLMEKELDFLGRALASPRHPFAAIVGGAKVSDKLKLLDNILTRVDALLIGGGMCATFLNAQGHGVGRSMVEDDRLGFVRGLVARASGGGVQLLLPTDLVVAAEFAAGAEFKVVGIADVPDGWYVMDIGPETVECFSSELRGCRTVLWNGPIGVFEFFPFRNGTSEIAKFLAALDATTIIGGGSTAEAVAQLGLTDRMSHVSTGGGAALEFLEGSALPGVVALQDKG